MTDPAHGENTGEGASGALEPHGTGVSFGSAPRRFAAVPSPLDDAHSPASPYTVASEPRPARALPMDDEGPGAVEAPTLPGERPATGSVAAAPDSAPAPGLIPVGTFPPVDSPPAPGVDPAPPPPALASRPGPAADDDYVEPPLVRRPYAISTPEFAPGPPTYVQPPPSRPSSPPATPVLPSFAPATGAPPMPLEVFSSPVPPPAGQAKSGTATPSSAPSAADVPALPARPYAQPAYGGYPPVVAPSPGAAPASVMDPYASFGGPDTTFGPLRVPSVPPGYGTARPRTENVGRGLLLALVAVIGGCVLAAIVYHMGYVASIVALAMGGAGIFLYSKGAGAPPRKGAVALVVLLVAGILLAWVSSVGTELYYYYVARTGSSNGALAFAVTNALSVDLFTSMLKDFLIFVGFGVLGIFGMARQLLVPRKRK